MATECYTQLGFGFQPKLVVDFTGGTLTTDAGLLLVREFDQQLGLSADVVGRITDTRDVRYITHEVHALVRQPWPHRRRILVKVDVTAQGFNVRFMVTNRRGRAADLITWYDDRGTTENWIKELKLDIRADRLSCHRFRAWFHLASHWPGQPLFASCHRALARAPVEPRQTQQVFSSDRRERWTCLRARSFTIVS